MDNIWGYLQPILKFAFSSLVSVAFFGLVLAFFWVIGPDTKIYKLITLIAAAAISIGIGGFVSAWITGETGLKQSLLFGILFGTFTFTYILGSDIRAVFSTLLATGISAFGGFIHHRLLRKHSTKNLSSRKKIS